MPKPWYSIKAAAEGSDVAEVSILEPISPWYGCSAKSFLDEFKALKASKVKLFINSPGGSVMEALAIFNGMRASGKEIEVHVLGVAASAASYIAMAGDRIVMPKNTMMFLHNPISGVYGNAEAMREQADLLDKFGAMLFSAYARRWSGEEQALKDVLAEETFLTADECLEHGLCDEVVDEITARAEFDLDLLPPEVRAVFATAPAAPEPKPGPTAAGVPVAEIEAIARECGAEAFVADLAVDAKLTTADAVRKRAVEAKDIADLCRVVQAADRARGFVAAGVSPAEARATLAREQAEAAEAARINTAPSATKVTGNPDAQASTWSPSSTWKYLNGEK